MRIDTKERTNVVNELTGELISSTSEVSSITTKCKNVDEFIQVYLEDISGLLGITTKGEYHVLVYAWKYAPYSDEANGNIVHFNKMLKDKIIDGTGLTDGSIKNILTKLVKKDLLIKTNYKSMYYLNPKYFFKGKLSDRTKAFNLQLNLNYRIEPNKNFDNE